MAKRRSNGEGSIVKRADGRWAAAVTDGIDYTTGKPIRVFFYGKTQGEVKEKLKNALNDKEQGVSIKPSKITFSQWLDIWHKEYAKPQVRPTTWDTYAGWIKNHIKPGLGNVLLKDLQPSQIQKFYNQKLTEDRKDHRPGKLSPRSVRHMHIIIHEALEQAVKEGKIPRNPAKATRPPKLEKKEATYLTSEQITAFLSSISEDRWFTAFLTVLGSGLRLGELVALKWENVDLQNGVIQVKEGFVRVRTGAKEGPKTKLILQQPKTKKGIRSVPIPVDVVNELKKWKAKQLQEKMLLQSSGRYHDLGFVFTWEDGRIVEPAVLSRHFLELIRKQHLEGIHFHSLRHSYASLMLKADVHPKIVQENLGHSTIAMTLDTYSHVAPGIKEAAAQKLNGMFSINKPPRIEEAKQ